MAVFPTLDFLQINSRYPNAVKRIIEWIFNQPELQSVTDEFIDPKHPEDSKEQFAGLMIQMDPRKLYDIFDSFGIFISVHLDESSVKFLYSTFGKDQFGRSYTADSRHEAEVSAFHDAFELLEKQLKNGEQGHKGIPGNTQG